MKVLAVLLSLASVAVASLRPYDQPGPQGGIATGAAGGDLTQGQSTGIHGTSQIQKLSSSAKVSKVQPDFFF